MCSATDSAPEPRNWKPVRGVRFSMPASNKKFAIRFMVTPHANDFLLSLYPCEKSRALHDAMIAGAW